VKAEDPNYWLSRVVGVMDWYILRADAQLRSFWQSSSFDLILRVVPQSHSLVRVIKNEVFQCLYFSYILSDLYQIRTAGEDCVLLLVKKYPVE